MAIAGRSGNKRKASTAVRGPARKKPKVSSAEPDLPEELGRAGKLLARVWDEAVVAAEAVRAAEGRMRAVEGRLREVDDWVRSLRRRI